MPSAIPADAVNAISVTFDAASVAATSTSDQTVTVAGAQGSAVDVLVGTVSRCHGAVNLLHLG